MTDEVRETYDWRGGQSREKVLAASALVRDRIDEFLSRELPESERRLLGRAADAKERSFGLAAVLMTLAVIAMVVAVNTVDLSGLAAQGLTVRILGTVGTLLALVTVFTLAAMPLAAPVRWRGHCSARQRASSVSSPDPYARSASPRCSSSSEAR
ncbi:hypothetical protein GA0070606_0728 [Micromonospora citrea]|uniref:Uncharacterized protein n=1 Tax=Micromonospora citrea TaxID=47855 RepID=A0A1C6TUH1_9ACTN|nr:hypothetical protein [Micromonospora citrea]SCL45397.1 hypothetical protein GA0070606_0728 [Micromonospora citrea]